MTKAAILKALTGRGFTVTAIHGHGYAAQKMSRTSNRPQIHSYTAKNLNRLYTKIYGNKNTKPGRS